MNRAHCSHDSTARPLLSLAMIVRDAGQYLAPLLAAANPWVDAMVIGDTGSTDDSRQIAKAAGARLLDVPWHDDFAAARNAVLDQISTGWVFCLDADEQLSPAGWSALRAWVEDHARSVAHAGILTTRNYVPGRHSHRGWRPVPDPDPHALAGSWPPAPGYTPTAKIRLFPARGDIRFVGILHETVEAAAELAGLDSEHLPMPVHHFGTLHPDPAKLEGYLVLARRKTELNPREPQAWSERADCALALGHADEALDAIDRALILEPNHPDRRLTAGWLLLEKGNLDQADAQLAGVAGSGCADDRQLAEACHLRAQIALRQGRQDVAGRLLAVALHLIPDNGHFHNTLGVWHLTAGRGDQARAALERACGLLPGVAEPWLNLGRMYKAAGHPEAARIHLQRALDLEPGNDAARAAIQTLETGTRAVV